MRRLAAVAVLLAVTAISAHAQTTASGLIFGYVKTLQRFLSVIMGVGALVSFTFSIYYMIEGKREAAKKLVFVILGLFIGSVLMYAVSGYVGTNGGGGSDGFGQVKGEVKAALQGALVIVAMITMTANTIKMIRGEEDGYRKIFVWVLACTMGSAMLNAI